MAGDADREALAAAIAANPDLDVTVDVENLQVVF